MICALAGFLASAAGQLAGWSPKTKGGYKWTGGCKATSGTPVLRGTTLGIPQRLGGCDEEWWCGGQSCGAGLDPPPPQIESLGCRASLRKCNSWKRKWSGVLSERGGWSGGPRSWNSMKIDENLGGMVVGAELAETDPPPPPRRISLSTLLAVAVWTGGG